MNSNSNAFLKPEVPNPQTAKRLAVSKKLIDKGDYYSFANNEEALEFLAKTLE